MTNDTANQRPQAGPRPYPRQCPECGKETVHKLPIRYDAKIKHDGRVYEFEVVDLPVDQCGNCNEVYFTNDSDIRLTKALRDHLGLLQPSAIRSSLKELGLTQRAFADSLGVAPETVSRWITGQCVQSRALDNFMRVFLNVPEARNALTSAEQ